MPVLVVFAPWHYVTGYQQTRIGNPSDAASFLKICEYRAAEKPLSDALIHKRLNG